jgi:hypothetical protein
MVEQAMAQAFNAGCLAAADVIRKKTLKALGLDGP